MMAMHGCMETVPLSPLEADWRLVRAFVAVMQAGTLTGAARQLGTTQPTVGRQIRALERMAGETYFLRRGVRLEPTDHAQVLFARALDVERAVTTLARSLATPQTSRSKVRITTSEIFGTQLMPLLIPTLLAKVPGVEIEVIATDRLQDLHRRDADLAIRFVAPLQPELIARQVGEVSLGLYATPGYLDQHGRPRSPADLRDHTLISSRDGTEVRTVARRLGLDLRPDSMPVRSDELLVRDSFIRAGLGIGACHTWLATLVPGLERVLPDLDVIRLPVWLVAHEDLRRSRSLRLLHDALADDLRARFQGGNATPAG
ncbi:MULTISPECIES: LysR family transcriptional regulator [unclassified Rhizobium]|uniref:LysR family transcriptional regulator n=1 Tax=unclassified Rhizobium TaxID=2613769 RepID=UPI00138ED77B|nr:MULTISPECIES: LysR family transcriptional regulator [unclassified Rhizobium]